MVEQFKNIIQREKSDKTQATSVRLKTKLTLFYLFYYFFLR